MKKKSKLITLGVSAFLVATLIVFYINYSSVRPDVSLSKLKLLDLNGKEVNVLNYVGKPIVINFWATWCATCIKEFPDFDIVKKQFDGKVVFLMISDEDIDLIKEFKNNHKFSFNYLKLNYEIESNTILPVTYIYNKKGELLKVNKGALTQSKLTQLLNDVNFK
jgi:thiol-disulfide isomerase/thioredoxin